ncbi:hypothetical protein FKG96_09870 [Olivibacter sp. LS-1]|uniref:hypothetical protein n=1 Tax=Olivibacter sp. LS-1 TaxID=2592345 RepID=UPI0011EAD7E2|nr:hypothetical protein [Olivibacter sp. LS-1]QEL01100.1 hypothetical protein FKG96_09870 [Olivibacter sp. LS-1]
MDKLELKHIAPYLPYGLKVQYIHTGEVGIIRNLVDIDDYYTIKIGIDYKDSEHIWMFKPILRPLSSLKNDIVIDGLKFNPFLRLYNLFLIEVSENLEVEVNMNNIMEGYCVVTQLISWHFDVFGLIDRGLAVESTKLED